MILEVLRNCSIVGERNFDDIAAVQKIRKF